MEAIQNIIFDNKKDIPDGVYLQLQNALKEAHTKKVGKDLYKCHFIYPCIRPIGDQNALDIRGSREIITITPEEKARFDSDGTLWLSYTDREESREDGTKMIDPSVLGTIQDVLDQGEIVSFHIERVMVKSIEEI